MSTSTPEALDLLHLYKCVTDTGTEVLIAFARYKLLSTYKGNFKQFLDDRKHELFHLWQNKKILCCKCPPTGYNFKRNSNMGNWIFEKIYDNTGRVIKGDVLYTDREISQECLHKYVTRNILLEDLDISVISFLLRNVTKLSSNEKNSLNKITTIRGQISHAPSTDSFAMSFLNDAWTDLENALVDLTDPYYQRMIKTQIKYGRKIVLEKEEITELRNNIEEVYQKVESSSNNNLAHLHGMETRLKTESINKTDAINQHTTKKTSHCAAIVSENLQKAMNEVKKSQENSNQKFGTQMDDMKVMLVEMSRTVKNLEMNVKYERPNVLVPEEAWSDAMERPVLWQIETPQHWNLEAVEATLRSSSQKDELFTLKFVRKGSLIMLTTIAASVLGDPESFEAAVMSFLTKMIEDCDINTNIPSRVDVRLHILNANEVSISCELPLEKRHQQTSGIKKKIAESVTSDVAFLNGDDIKEIQWVQNVSKKLKTKFDVNCAILSKDYLNGFPLRTSLGQYFHMFKAVIVTITKENHELYDYFIEDNMSVIAVELDYINEVRLNLRKCQHINCTTCEHLWFPQLMNILKTVFPDHLRKEIESYTDEVDVNCEKCMQSATTAVYHGIGLMMAVEEKQLILCGSLTDESWILNLLYQITNFTEPYRITTWVKSIETPCQFISNTVFVLDSPNLIKCKQINDYSDCYRLQANTLYTVMIAPSVRSISDGSPDNYIDATSMNCKELADQLFLSTRRLDNFMDFSSEISKRREDSSAYSSASRNSSVSYGEVQEKSKRREDSSAYSSASRNSSGSYGEVEVPFVQPLVSKWEEGRTVLSASPPMDSLGLFKFVDNSELSDRTENSFASSPDSQVSILPPLVPRLERGTGESYSPSTDALESFYYTTLLGSGRGKNELSSPYMDVHGLYKFVDNSALSKRKEDSFASSPDSQDQPSKRKKIKETHKNPWSKEQPSKRMLIKETHKIPWSKGEEKTNDPQEVIDKIWSNYDSQ